MVSFSSLLLSALTITSIGAAPQQLEVDVDFRPNAELVCYECARTPDNDTCAIGLENLPKVTAVGQVNNLIIVNVYRGTIWRFRYQTWVQHIFKSFCKDKLASLLRRQIEKSPYRGHFKTFRLSKIWFNSSDTLLNTTALSLSLRNEKFVKVEYDTTSPARMFPLKVPKKFGAIKFLFPGLSMPSLRNGRPRGRSRHRSIIALHPAGLRPD